MTWQSAHKITNKCHKSWNSTIFSSAKISMKLNWQQNIEISRVERAKRAKTGCALLLHCVIDCTVMCNLIYCCLLSFFYQRIWICRTYTLNHFRKLKLNRFNEMISTRPWYMVYTQLKKDTPCTYTSCICSLL